jgi:hypothetical protein
METAYGIISGGLMHFKIVNPALLDKPYDIFKYTSTVFAEQRMTKAIISHRSGNGTRLYTIRPCETCALFKVGQVRQAYPMMPRSEDSEFRSCRSAERCVLPVASAPLRSTLMRAGGRRARAGLPIWRQAGVEPGESNQVFRLAFLIKFCNI